MTSELVLCNRAVLIITVITEGTNFYIDLINGPLVTVTSWDKKEGLLMKILIVYDQYFNVLVSFII